MKKNSLSQERPVRPRNFNTMTAPMVGLLPEGGMGHMPNFLEGHTPIFFSTPITIHNTARETRQIFGITSNGDASKNRNFGH